MNKIIQDMIPRLGNNNNNKFNTLCVKYDTSRVKIKVVKEKQNAKRTLSNISNF